MNLLDVSNISMGFPNKDLFSGLSFTVKEGERLEKRSLNLVDNVWQDQPRDGETAFHDFIQDYSETGDAKLLLYRFPDLVNKLQCQFRQLLT